MTSMCGSLWQRREGCCLQRERNHLDETKQDDDDLRQYFPLWLIWIREWNIKFWLWCRRKQTRWKNVFASTQYNCALLTLETSEGAQRAALVSACDLEHGSCRVLIIPAVYSRSACGCVRIALGGNAWGQSVKPWSVMCQWVTVLS